MKRFQVVAVVVVWFSAIFARAQNDGGYRSNPCDLAFCSGNTRCVVEQVQCFAPLCPPTASCKPIYDAGPIVTTTNPCAAASCPRDTECVVEQVLCYAPPCLPTASCRPLPSRPSCANLRCGFGTRCLLQNVQCFRAPCYPVPQCVPHRRRYIFRTSNQTAIPY